MVTLSSDVKGFYLPMPVTELYIAIGIVVLFLPVVIIFTRAIGFRQPPVRVDKQE